MRSPNLFDKRREPNLEHPKNSRILICRVGFSRTADFSSPKHIAWRILMKHSRLFLAVVATIAGLAALIAPAPGHANGQSAAPYVTEIPQGYRGWKWISSAHEAGKLNSLGAVLGNDVAFNASGMASFRTRTARLLSLYITRTSHRQKTTKSLARTNLSFPGPPQTFSLWSRTRRNTPQPVAGGSATSGRQTCRRGVHETLLPLPREGQSDRPRLHSLRTLKDCGDGECPVPQVRRVPHSKFRVLCEI
jgi:hypothetical protein